MLLKLFWNNFRRDYVWNKMISAFYVTWNHLMWWLHVRQNAEIISKLFYFTCNHGFTNRVHHTYVFQNVALLDIMPVFFRHRVVLMDPEVSESLESRMAALLTVSIPCPSPFHLPSLPSPSQGPQLNQLWVWPSGMATRSASGVWYISNDLVHIRAKKSIC